MIVALLVLLFFAGFVSCLVVVGRAMDQRRERLELALDPTCLLCNSRDLELGVPPEYRCRSCGFDTHKAGALTTELERYAELTRRLAADPAHPDANRVQQERAEVRRSILAQMSADGAVERDVLDFEHVVAKDYEGL